MWVEFVVGSVVPAPRVFLQILRPAQKPTFSNYSLTWKLWTNKHSVDVPHKISIYLLLFRIFICLSISPSV